MTTVATSTRSFSGLAIAGRVAWFVVWAVLTALAVFQVAKHGYVEGSALDAFLLSAVAFGAFILPDLTFLVGLGQPVEKGYLPTRAVPYYNALHRFWPALLATGAVVVVLGPLGSFGVILFVAGLSWMAHVALDRAAGYGLRNPDGSR